MMPLGMGGGQAVGDLGGVREGLGGAEGAALDLGPQALAAAEGHGDEHLPAIALADLVDGADVGVVEDGGRLGLVDEALAGLGVVGELQGQELEGHGAAELEVVGLIDDSHAASADLAEDAVLAGDNSPGEEAAGKRVDGRRERWRVGRRGHVLFVRVPGLGARGGRVRCDERRSASPAKAGRARIRGAASGAIQRSGPPLLP